ncbi:hypothetical protein MIMGU_mgv1a014712mg [Erythranthe guttata]|uniref:Uncharacterized protein n=1 Tax=Erythranthe guttata TaxID=4155 RepID=A0A022RUI6_ERYGU|nr:hypothetical protein MIMGU_mgv1a014712mg [Erythranthe guttata]
MGCCSSTDNNKSPPPKTAHLSNSTRECGNSKSPPPLQQEEEEVTVKEVVSEKTRSAKTGSLLTADGEPGLQNGAFFSKPAVANQSAAFSIPTPENNGDELRGTRRRSEQSTGQNRPEYDRGMDSEPGKWVKGKTAEEETRGHRQVMNCWKIRLCPWSVSSFSSVSRCWFGCNYCSLSGLLL